MQTHRGHTQTQKQTQTRFVGWRTPGRPWRNASLGSSGQRRRDGGYKSGEHVEDEANEHSVTTDHPPQCAVGRLRAGSWYAGSFRPDSTSAGLHIIMITPRANPSPGQLAHAD